MKEEHALDDDETEEDPTPFVFDPADAIERAIAEAMSVQKEVSLTKQKMTEMVVTHEGILVEHRRGVKNPNKKSRCMRTCSARTIFTLSIIQVSTKLLLALRVITKTVAIIPVMATAPITNGTEELSCVFVKFVD